MGYLEADGGLDIHVPLEQNDYVNERLKRSSVGESPYLGMLKNKVYSSLYDLQELEILESDGQ